MHAADTQMDAKQKQSDSIYSELLLLYLSLLWTYTMASTWIATSPLHVKDVCHSVSLCIPWGCFFIDVNAPAPAATVKIVVANIYFGIIFCILM